MKSIFMYVLLLFITNVCTAQTLPMFNRHDYYHENLIRDIILDDFNNDNVIDMAVFISELGISISLGKGDGTFEENRAIEFETTDLNNFILSDDFNLDGNKDLIVSTKLFLGDGDGNFFKEIELNFAGVFHPIVGDLNNDGYPDLLKVKDPVIEGQSIGKLLVSLGKGDGYFFNEIELNYSGVFPPLIGDVNNDGYPDFVTLREEVIEEQPIRHIHRELLVTSGNGDGTFGEPVASMLPEAKVLYLRNISDFNNDSMPDILVYIQLAYDEYGPLFRPAAPISSNNIGIMTGNGDGTFGDMIVTRWFGAWSIGDFNNDDILDVIGGSFAAPEYHVLLGDGKGTFTSSWQSPDNYGYGPPGYFILDFNSDNIIDIGYFITSGEDFHIREILVFVGAGNGAFDNPVGYNIENFNFHIYRQKTVVSDLNNDRFDDFIIVPSDSSFVSVFINNGYVSLIEHDEKQAVSPFTMHQNYPNPFNNYTLIPYRLEFDSFVSLEIYDISGQNVRTLVNDFKNSGTYHVLWDCRNNANDIVASGVYMCVMKGGDSGMMSVRKMLLVQ